MRSKCPTRFEIIDSVPNASSAVTFDSLNSLDRTCLEITLTKLCESEGRTPAQLAYAGWTIRRDESGNLFLCAPSSKRAIIEINGIVCVIDEK